MEDGIEMLAPARRGRSVIESPFPQRKNRVEDELPASQRTEDTREAPMQHQPWSDFTAAKLLPNSVYLWACDEVRAGESRPSRSDAWAAWIILITQMMCYIQLIMVSSTELSEDPPRSSSTIEGSYSLVSVAAAMYLMTSIAASDLGAGIALISEARMDMAAKRWVQRKIFGLMLLASFVLLAAASIRVLFKTSSEDVELVVGAATVLFIADVDEKLMVVLKVIPYKWRLFWVLEAIGVSTALALLGLRVTGSGSNVSENGNAGCTYGHVDRVGEDCLIYSWYFILCNNPVSVTLVSLLLNSFVASPKDFVKKHVLGNGSRKDGIFALFLALWILEPLWVYFHSGGWTNEASLIVVSIYVIGGACWLLVCIRSVCCRGSDQSNTGHVNFRWTSRTRFKLLYSPVGLLLLGIVLIALSIKHDVAYSEIDILDPSQDWFFVSEAIYVVLFEMWLVWCMYGEASGSPEKSSSPEAANMAVTEPVMIAGSDGPGSETNSHKEGGARRLTGSLLLGWIQANALWSSYQLLWELIFRFIDYPNDHWAFMAMVTLYLLAWILIGACAAASSTKGVAFWSLATYMLDSVVIFFSEWKNSDGVVILLPKS